MRLEDPRLGDATPIETLVARNSIALAGTLAPGATPAGGSRTRFVVWAPATQQARVHLLGENDRWVDLAPAPGGYHVGIIEHCPAGTRYRYALDDGEELADPASRYQPDGVHGPSEVVDLGTYEWADSAYRPRPLWQHVISECHVGTLTESGTFDGAQAILDDLVDVGINAVELMPVSQFPGSRNWGYDGVFPYAVQSTYGGPVGLQRFVDACHRRGLAVILDVVYNHIGPEGNVLDRFGPYFNDHYRTPWGPAINFDGRDSDAVRAYFLRTALQWFADFHVDALRLDAIHGIIDPTASPFLAELSALAASLGELRGRPCGLIAESADNNPAVVTDHAMGGLGMDAQWNDDFHHALHTALTGERQGYYIDFGGVEDLARAMSEGFVFQGEHSTYRGRRHGAPSLALAPERLVVFAENHDQAGNRPRGERLSTLLPPDRLRLAAALVLVAPGVPLLFMGDEYGEVRPFPFFIDHGDPELIEAVRRGRADELRGLGFEVEPLDPASEATYQSAILDRSGRDSAGGRTLLALHRRLIDLRSEQPALGRSRRTDVRTDVIGPVLSLTRWHPAGAVAVLSNLGPHPATAILGATSRDAWDSATIWRRLLDSGDPELGGSGTRQPDQVAAGAPLSLDRWAFCIYGSGPSSGVSS